MEEITAGAMNVGISQEGQKSEHRRGMVHALSRVRVGAS